MWFEPSSLLVLLESVQLRVFRKTSKYLLNLIFLEEAFVAPYIVRPFLLTKLPLMFARFLHTVLINSPWVISLVDLTWCTCVLVNLHEIHLLNRWMSKTLVFPSVFHHYLLLHASTTTTDSQNRVKSNLPLKKWIQSDLEMLTVLKTDNIGLDGRSVLTMSIRRELRAHGQRFKPQTLLHSGSLALNTLALPEEIT